ncbi:MAG: hypothetical protein FWJ93_00700 [Micromonosporaceae bacterium]
MALLLAVLGTALIVLCGTSVVLLSQYTSTLSSTDRAGSGGLAASPTPTGPHSPQPGDPPRVHAAWVRAQIDKVLEGQADALLRGDEQGFLAVAAADDATVREELTRRYRSLTALQVARWTSVVAAPPRQETSADGRTEWVARLSLRHCFAVPTCSESDLRVESRWVERDGRPYLVSLQTSGASQNGPRPWEVADLRVAAGQRAVVATTAKYASRLPGLLREAERAAAVADKYVIGAPPDRYYVYFAGAEEWKQWYSGNLPKWAAGFAVPVSARDIEVVLNAAQTPSSFIDDIMRHELTHVAALRGARDKGNKWWLIEGLAEHAELHGQAVRQHDAVSTGAVRRFIRSGKWDGAVTVTEPGSNASAEEAAARYGIAFLAVRRLVDRYGEAKVLSFVEAVVHDDKAPEVAAPEVFGVAWAAVQADCVSYIRSTAG